VIRALILGFCVTDIELDRVVLELCEAEPDIVTGGDCDGELLTEELCEGAVVGEEEMLAEDEMQAERVPVTETEVEPEFDGECETVEVSVATLAVAHALPIELTEGIAEGLESCDRVCVTTGEIDCRGEMLERGDSELLVEGERE